ncbi:MAG: YicC family protein [Gammaproteobacteria bacterium]|nr:YicC family protein [Gammaproteobacteria bacterium]
MIQSMTAYARQSDQGAWGMATWEIRSVNHRYLDCSIKIPEALRQIETTIRQTLQQKIHRGRVECNLKYQPGEKCGLNLTLNQPLLKKLLSVVAEIKQVVPDSNNIDLMKILSWPQVVQFVEEDTEFTLQAIQSLFLKTLADLEATRIREGAELKNFLMDKLSIVLQLTKKAEQRAPQILVNQKTKLLSRLAEIKGELDNTRLEQEMVFFAQRIDITEELDRLTTHAKEMQRILTNGGNVGKRLDFLLQELNREANTMAAKSVDNEITGIAVELKVYLEQMREQVQNIV